MNWTDFESNKKKQRNKKETDDEEVCLILTDNCSCVTLFFNYHLGHSKNQKEKFVSHSNNIIKSIHKEISLFDRLT